MGTPRSRRRLVLFVALCAAVIAAITTVARFGGPRSYGVTPEQISAPVPASDSDPPLFVVRVGGKHGCIDEAGRVVIEPKYENLHTFREGLAAAFESGKWGYIDRAEKWVIPPSFATAADFSEGLAAVRVHIESKHGYIDRSGALVIRPVFDVAHNFHDGEALVGFATLKGRIMAQFADVGLQCRYERINRNGRSLGRSTLSFDPTPGREGLVPKWANRLGGYADASGKFVIPPQYTEAMGFQEGLAGVRIGKKMGFVDVTGAEVIPLRFDWVFPFENGLAQVGLEGKSGYIDKTGAWVWEPTD